MERRRDLGSEVQYKDAKFSELGPPLRDHIAIPLAASTTMLDNDEPFNSATNYWLPWSQRFSLKFFSKERASRVAARRDRKTSEKSQDKKFKKNLWDQGNY